MELLFSLLYAYTKVSCRLTVPVIKHVLANTRLCFLEASNAISILDGDKGQIELEFPGAFNTLSVFWRQFAIPKN